MSKYLTAILNDDIKLAAQLWKERTKEEGKSRSDKRTNAVEVSCCGERMLFGDSMVARCEKCEEEIDAIEVVQALGLESLGFPRPVERTTNWNG